MRALAGITLATALLAGCAGDAALSGWTEALPQAGVRSGDALLSQARKSLRGGVLSEEHEAAILASAAPEHARARRVLEAMRTPVGTAAEPVDAHASTDALDAPRLQLATPRPDAGVPPRRASRAAQSSSSSVRKTRTATPPVPTRTTRTTLNGVGLKRTHQGAALSLSGSGGLVVGIANQPQSGIVRLVMDAEASTAALRSRPKVTGAKVTGVRRTGKTVFVTLALDPGWSLRGIVRTRGGARVDPVSYTHLTLPTTPYV